MPIANQDLITSSFVRQFADTYEMAAQQKVSRLMGTVLNEGTVVGSSFTINDLGSIDFSAAGARFSGTNLTIPTAGARVVNMADFSLFVPIEPRDLVKLKADPTDSYMQSIIAGRNRLIDSVIYNGLLNPILRKVSESDSTLVATALPAGQIIPAGGTGFTKAKIIAAAAKFRKNQVDDEELFILYNSEMMTAILSDTTLTSADFMAVQMLQSGEISGKWLGFTWIHYEGPSGSYANGAGGATEARTVAYAKSGARFGEATIVPIGINERYDLAHVHQISSIESYGAGRTNELKVIGIDFNRQA